MQNNAQRLINLVEENFSNGIRDDFIDTSKIMHIFSYHYPNEPILLDSIVNIIHENGIENSGRFYFISQENIETIQFFLDEILKKNHLAYYSSVYRNHFDFFVRLKIFSSEVLKKTLHLYDRRHYHFPEFCATKKFARLDLEIETIFKKMIFPLSCDDLQKKLPYVPAEKIAAVLSDSKKFFLTRKRLYILISKLQFDTTEIDRIKNRIRRHISAAGSASLEDFDFSLNFAQNPELSEKDLQNVIYEKFLSRDFIKRGNKLFKKSSASQKNHSLSLFDKLRNFVESQNELPVKKLFDVAQNLEIAPYSALSIAYEKMIRVDKNFLVKDSLINFDVEQVDEALTDFVQGKIIPLSAVTSFTCFPPIKGYSWNLFMLESFLRKFSKKYVFSSTGTSTSSTGSIYPKFMKFADYLEVQVAAVVQEKIPLKKFDVEDFLIEQGYRTKRLANITEKIIRRAQEILNR